MGYATMYKFDYTNVDVEYDIVCTENGHVTDTYKENATASLKATTYSQTHFTSKLGTFNSANDCTDETNRCIKEIDGKHILTPSEIETQFADCFKGIGSVNSKALTTNSTSSSQASNMHAINSLCFVNGFILIFISLISVIISQ